MVVRKEKGGVPPVDRLDGIAARIGRVHRYEG